MAYFNPQVVNAFTLNFGQLEQNYVTKDPIISANKYGLGNAGYHFISVTGNMGFILVTLFYMTQIFFFCSSLILFFVYKPRRCGQLRLGKRCLHITENISTPSYINFGMSSSIVQLISALVYLRFSDSYASKLSISDTRVFS